MPRFYFRVATELGHGRRLTAVCYGLVGGLAENPRFHVLLVDEWGEKELLRKMRDMGLFELGQAFIPVGPQLGEDLAFITSRAIACGILRLDVESAAALVEKKLAGSRVCEEGGRETRAEGPAGRETNAQLAKRLCDEGAAFLRRNIFVT